MMRGTDEESGSLFNYVDLEDRIPAQHPLRKFRQVVIEAVTRISTVSILNSAHFDSRRSG